MSTNSQHTEDFLNNANDAELEQAIAENHKQLFCLNTDVLQGDVVHDGGLTYTWAKQREANIPFPVPGEMDLSEKLDAMIWFYGSREADNVGCWSLDPALVPGLAAGLLARGFQPGWKPCWMVLDLQATGISADNIPGLTIETDNNRSIFNEKDLPYGDGGALSDELLRHHPSRVQRFLAYIDGHLVGQCCLFFSAAPSSIAGMYNVGVIPSMRRKGIGMAIVLAACRFAKELGYQYVTLNANEMGRPVYERAGFRFINYGLTWWLIGKNYITHPASKNLIALAVLVAEGDIIKLRENEDRLSNNLLNQQLSNGFTLVDIAVHFRQPEAAAWLLAKGATITALTAWELGWKDRAAELLSTDPEEKNRLYFDWKGTLLHVAVLRNDSSLAQLALDAGVDLQVQDSEHHSTGLGWAEYFRRFAIIGMIKKKMTDKT